MKEVSKEINKFKKGDIEKSLKFSYATALNDNNFQSLVNSLKISDKVGYKYCSKLKDTVLELNNCSNCKGIAFCKNKVEGFIFYPKVEEDKIIFSYMACKYKKKILNDKKKINYYELPYDLQNASMSKIDLTDKKRTKVIKLLKEFYDNYVSKKECKGLYLHGSFGSGKTYLVMAMLNELAKKQYNIEAVYFPFLLRNLKESFKDNFSGKINSIMKADIILLDDIGAETVSSWSRDEILGSILQYRMDNHLPTFFTSNYTIEELENHFSQTKISESNVSARRVIERIKQLTDDIELVSVNRRK